MTNKLKPEEKKTYWIKKCDELFSKIVRARFGHCIETKTTENLQCAHVISRSYFMIRWDYENAVALSSKRHRFYTDRPLEWENFITEFIGMRIYNKLKRKALKHANSPKSIPELRRIYARLTKDWNNLSFRHGSVNL